MNYPPGFTQSDHDDYFGREPGGEGRSPQFPSCTVCGATFDTKWTGDLCRSCWGHRDEVA